MLFAQKIMGDIYLEYRDAEKAISHYDKMKQIAELLRNYKSKLVAYKQLGYCHQLLKNYKKSVIYYKKMLQLAWDVQLTPATRNYGRTEELNAYDSLGLQYYYIGDMDRAAYYHDRCIRGKLESESSFFRKISQKTLQDRRNKMSLGVAEGRGLEADLAEQSDESELPSPRGGDKSSIEILPGVPLERQEEEEQQAKKGTSNISTAVRGVKFEMNLPTIGKVKTKGSTFKGNIKQQTQTLNDRLKQMKDQGNKRFQSRAQEGPMDIILYNHLSPNRCIQNFPQVEQSGGSQKFKEKFDHFMNVLQNGILQKEKEKENEKILENEKAK